MGSNLGIESIERHTTNNSDFVFHSNEIVEKMRSARNVRSVGADGLWIMDHVDRQRPMGSVGWFRKREWPQETEVATLLNLSKKRLYGETQP